MDQTDCRRGVGGMLRHNNICNKTEGENRIKQGFELEEQHRSSKMNTQHNYHEICPALLGNFSFYKPFVAQLG